MIQSSPTINTRFNLIGPLLSKEELHINSVTKGEQLLADFMDINRPDWTEINAKTPAKNQVTDVLP